MISVSKEAASILMIAVITAFCVNFISPSGIALMGEWDVDAGVISAEQKGMELDRNVEIGSTAEALKIMNAGQALFIDVRPWDSFADGHIQGSISIPLHDFDQLIMGFMENYQVSTPIVTYCSGRECMDSHEAAQYLLDSGYTNVRVYIDGYPGWKEEGLPVEP